MNSTADVLKSEVEGLKLEIERLKQGDGLIDVLRGVRNKIEFASGHVILVDIMPRKVQRSIEDAIVLSARTSFASGLKSIKQDSKLVRYLLVNRHTSPLESVKFSFHLRLPVFSARQIIRHRTANINEFSMRYAQVQGRYKPISDPEGIRVQCSVNKQSSKEASLEKEEQIYPLMYQIEELLDQVQENYEKLLALGCAKEVARFCLPMSSWTELIFTIDLNNFLKFLSLRMDHHAQKEIRDVAGAMWELTKDLMPTVRDWFEEANPHIFKPTA
ncbi:Thymidylate synthase ThyX [Cedratvirus Zaza IHUMI]|uniref:Thymidylate synthase ThyX n=1 Tax=Cedratvirus Zaza IHUMI TaxID=2126979 RepID=A0A2R8FCX4_9VIRU|nr:Thymidylate synthase ThyX [Cedratvirus Zaza IHUMI]